MMRARQNTHPFAIVFVANAALYLFVGCIVWSLMAAHGAQRREVAGANRRFADWALTVEQLKEPTWI